MQMISFSASGWETWDVSRQPLIREQMPVLIDDDLLFEDAPGSPRPTTMANRYLGDLPINGAPAVRTWENSAGCLSAWLAFLQERGGSSLRGPPGVAWCAEHVRRVPTGRSSKGAVGPHHVESPRQHPVRLLRLGEGRGRAHRRALHLPRGAQDRPGRAGDGQEEHGQAAVPSASHDDQASGVGFRRAVRTGARWSRLTG